MAGSGGEIAAGAAGRLRASHGDRNRVIDVLKAAFTQGMLDKDEFDLRVGRVLTSRTYADLAALTADIPATPAAAQPPPPVPTRQSQERRFVKALACALVVVPTTMVGYVLIAGHHLAPAAIILSVVLFACMVGVPATLLVMVHSWLDNRESRSTSPGSPPSTPGTASWRLAPAQPEGQPTQISHDPPGTTEAARRRPRPPLLNSRPPHPRSHLGHPYAIG
jgi:Domain of unknown function (DUF1707)